MPLTSYRIDIDGKDGLELYVVSAEEPSAAVEAGLKRYQIEHCKRTPRKYRLYTLTGKLLLEEFLGDSW